MSILLFVVVLVVLILVHEFGHFLTAKAFKMRVDEFGVGYPPRAWGIKRGETEYTLNWLPFGGFVKIHGEDGTEGVPDPRSFTSKPKWQQATVLVAGIVMNLVLAYVLLTGTLAAGMPRALAPEEVATATDTGLLVSAVLPGSPAEKEGVLPGDIIRSVDAVPGSFEGADTEAFSAYVGALKGKTLGLRIDRNGTPLTISVIPVDGLIEVDKERAALGVSIAPLGTIAVPLLEAPIEGAKLTYEATKQTAIGLAVFFGGLFTFSADLSQVSGPIGIAGAVGSASQSGIVSLLTLTALISINLALINLLPVPALDGGRLLFVIIEAVTRKRIPATFAGIVNLGGFALLILLMLVVTASDLFKIFS